MKKFIDNLKVKIEENPVIAIAIGTTLIHAVAKLITARAYSKDVNLRVSAQKK